MTCDDFITELRKAGPTVRRFAGFMRMQPVSISDSKKGDVPDRLVVITSLLIEMSAHSIDFEPIFARFEPGRKKPRGTSKPGKFAGDPQGVLELDK